MEMPSARAVALLKAMTLDEKLTLFHGSCGGPSGVSGYVGNVCENTRLGIPALKMNDGPQGFRDNEHLGSTTAWPCSLAIGATFDTEAAPLVLALALALTLALTLAMRTPPSHAGRVVAPHAVL